MRRLHVRRATRYFPFSQAGRRPELLGGACADEEVKGVPLALFVSLSGGSLVGQKEEPGYEARTEKGKKLHNISEGA